jgi:hypothetical protein
VQFTVEWFAFARHREACRQVVLVGALLVGLTAVETGRVAAALGLAFV